MAIHSLLDAHLLKVVGAGGYTAGTGSATVSASLSASQLSELIRVCDTVGYTTTLASGVLTVAHK